MNDSTLFKLYFKCVIAFVSRWLQLSLREQTHAPPGHIFNNGENSFADLETKG